MLLLLGQHLRDLMVVDLVVTNHCLVLLRKLCDRQVGRPGHHVRRPL